MILTNCNGTEFVDCGCGVMFTEYTNNTINKLEVGNLIGLGCTLEKYIIDWHLDTTDGPIVLITGTPDTSTDIQQYHPFMGNSGRYIELPAGRTSVVYVPVLRKFWKDGVDYYARPIRCRRWCDIESTLPSITILKGGCSTNNSDNVLYTYKMQYSGTYSVLGRTQSVNYDINSDVKWLAFYFITGIVSDTVNFYFRDSVTPIPYSSYKIADTVDVFDGNNVPFLYDSSSVKVVIDLTEDGIREIHDDDYIRVEVIGDVASTTDWTLYLKCLSADTFSGSCDYFTTNVKTVNVNSIAVTPPTAACTDTIVTFNMLGNLSDFITSPLNNYISIGRTNTSNVYDYETGAVSISFPNKIDFIATIVLTRSNAWAMTAKRFYYAHNKAKGWFIVSFHDELTFKNAKNDYSYVQTRPSFTNAPYWVRDEFNNLVPTTPDKVGYYKTFLFYTIEYRRRTDGRVEDGNYADASAFVRTREPHWHIKSATEFSNNISGSYVSKGAELIFTHSTIGVQFTNPTITTLTGNLDGAVIPKYLHTNDPYKPLITDPDTMPQTTLLVLVGNSGSALITFPDSSTATITYDGVSLLTTAQSFVSANPYSIGGVTMTCTQPGDYVNTLKVTYYKGIEDDFLSFPDDPVPDPYCRGPMKSKIGNGYSVASIASTYNAEDWTGHAGAYQGDGYDLNWIFKGGPAAINAFAFYERPNLVYEFTSDIEAYFQFKSLNNVCLSGMNDTTGWRLIGTGNNVYEFGILRIKIVFSDPTCIDRDHYVIYSMMDPVSGQLLPEEDWIILKDTRV